MLPTIMLRYVFLLVILGRLLLPSPLWADPTQARYPASWFEKVDDPKKPEWEILPQEAKPGEVILSKRTSLGILSNFAETPFTMDGVRYASVEGFWQAMLYPEEGDKNDPRLQVPWPRSRKDVAALSGFAAKDAGKEAKAILAKLGISWVSYRGKRLWYKTKQEDIQAHLRLVEAAQRCKAEQNPRVAEVLLSTGDLQLVPDHVQPNDRTPAYAYHQIWMDLRSRLRKQEAIDAQTALSRWSKDNRERILAALPIAYTRSANRIAVFDADGTLWHGDVPREFLLYQVRAKNLLHFDYSEPPEATVARLYDTCKSEVTLCIAQAGYLHVGLRLADLSRHMAGFFATFDNQVFLGQKQLMKFLTARGFRIYVVSGGPHFLAAYAAQKYFGLPPEQVLGVQLRLLPGQNPVLSAEVIPPVPFREGKMRAMDKLIGKEILIAVGNTGSDVPMLEKAQILPIAVHSFEKDTPGFHFPAEQELLKQAGERGWPIQRFVAPYN